MKSWFTLFIAMGAMSFMACDNMKKGSEQIIQNVCSDVNKKEAEQIIQRAREEAAKNTLDTCRQAIWIQVDKKRKEILADPNKFLTMEDYSSFHKGILNRHREIYTIRVRNTSPLPVIVKQGRFFFFNQYGKELGSVMIDFSPKLIAPDEALTFSKENGTLSSENLHKDAQKGRIEFLKIDVKDPLTRLFER